MGGIELRRRGKHRDPTGYELHKRDRATYDNVGQFYGPLCHPGDVLLGWKRFPCVAPGDVSSASWTPAPISYPIR